jgi:hypothetical protein
MPSIGPDSPNGGESACTPDSVRRVALTSPNAEKLVLSSENVFRWLSSFVVVARCSEDQLRTERHGPGIARSSLWGADRDPHAQ